MKFQMILKNVAFRLLINWHFNIKFYEQDKFHAQLSSAWKVLQPQVRVGFTEIPVW